MSLSNRVTELLERWLGSGERLEQTSPYVTIGDTTDSAGVTDSALNVNEFADFNTVLGAGLNPKVSGPAGPTAHCISTTVENFVTPLRTTINLSNVYYPTIAQKLYMLSTSTEDNPAGTGAAIVGISGLDSGYNQIFDIVTLDGITPVETNLEFIRANACYILSFGSGNVITADERFAAGNLYISGTANLTGGLPDDPMLGIDGTTTDVYLRDIANREGLYSVPNNKVLIMNDYTCTTELSKNCKIGVHVRLFGEDFFRMVSPQTLNAGVSKLSFDSVFAIPPRSDIQIRTKNVSGGSNEFVSVNFVGHLYDIS